MKINAKLDACVMFACFLRDHPMQPIDLAELITLANKAFAAGERETGGKDAEPARRRFEEKATTLGYKTDWSSGLWPVLKDAGNNSVFIPSL